MLSFPDEVVRIKCRQSGALQVWDKLIFLGGMHHMEKQTYVIILLYIFVCINYEWQNAYHGISWRHETESPAACAWDALKATPVYIYTLSTYLKHGQYSYPVLCNV